jgi:pantoate--beta-alanine ligase
MKVFYTLAAWLEEKQKRAQKSLGFVPTMGNLHAGHLSLVERSQKENKETLVSIFINQTQFHRAEDYEHYPRTLEADLAYLEQAGVTYCLVPEMNDMYPDHYQFQVHETTHHQKLEGKHRPGHFTGVLTIVMKLLNLVSPHHAYFGEKDFEQLQYIRAMTAAFFMDVKIVGCKTLREASGLAYSSRNNRLSTIGREQAEKFAKCFHATASLSLEKARVALSEFDIEYLEEDADRRFAAVYIEGIRLIDHCALIQPVSVASILVTEDN